MIDLTFLRENPELAKNIKLEVSGADLLAFGKAIHNWATEEGKEHIPKETEEYLTAAQMTEILKISAVSLWAWDKKGITKPLRIGNAKRYRRSDLEKIISNG